MIGLETLVESSEIDELPWHANAVPLLDVEAELAPVEALDNSTKLQKSASAVLTTCAACVLDGFPPYMRVLHDAPSWLSLSTCCGSPIEPACCECGYRAGAL